MVDVISVLEREIYPYLPDSIKGRLQLVQSSILERIVEIRLRIKQPLLIVLPDIDYTVASGGVLRTDPQNAYLCTEDDIARVVQAISKSSIYALEQELKMGYITIEGGHRIGLAGQAIMNQGELKAIKNISSLNIRIAREVKKCADALMPYLIGADCRIKNSLVVAPPRCGKTTLLRDIIRNLSGGNELLKGVQVGVVDERSELAACKNGIVTVDLGWRVDVLDGCPKAVGILMLIRTMAPAVIVTDELGRAEDVFALEEALNAGVSVIASVHGRNMHEIAQRPFICELIEKKYFDCYIFLSDRPRIGTLTQVICAKNDKVLYENAERGKKTICC